MTTRTWNGLVGDWNTDADWSPATSGDDTPAPGDTAIVASGTLILTANGSAANGLFENNKLTLGGALGATLLLRDPSPIGRYFNITLAGAATIEADGERAIAGSITGAPNDGSTLTFESTAGGDLILLHGGSFNVADRAVDFAGNVTLERDASISGNIVNNGTLSILSGSTTFATNSLTGTGTINIGGNGSFFLQGNGYGGANQTISFSGLGGTLGLDYQSPNFFSGTITNFAQGDFIDFVGVGDVTSAAVDTSAHTLTLTTGFGAHTYVIHNFFAAAGALTSVVESNGHSLVGYSGAVSGALQNDTVASRLNDQLAAGARAMHADIVHQWTAPGTSTPITGVGVKIGIISDSFNLKGGAASDIAQGYLPASGVTVLSEGAAGAYDEGRAMAELIYQTAPGASLYFAATGPDSSEFATAVQALQAAGCTVIVDDIIIGAEPYFQLGSPADNAVSNAIASGVTFVSAASNYGDAYYQNAFTTTARTLYDGSAVQALTFSNGTPYQSITALGGSWDTISLQWDASYYGAGGVAGDQPCCVTIKAFDATTNALVGTSEQVSADGHLVAQTALTLPGSYSSKAYNIVIYHNDGAPAVNEIKYEITGIGFTGGTGVGGRIDDPDAGSGSGAIAGHALVPGSIVVGAADVANTPASGSAPDYTEWFSSTGTGQLLYDANGNRLAAPVNAGSPDVVGPDGIQTSVSGFTPFYGTSAAAPNVAAVAALIQQVDPGISPAMLASILAQSATPLSDEPVSVAGAGLVQADRAIQLAEALACFCAGTMILTNCGEVAVETLKRGDRVMTTEGLAKSVTWIGRRVVSAAFADPVGSWPIRVKAGALSDNVPGRDLLLSPDHALLIDGVLIHAGALVNGTSIIRETDIPETFVYYHVELDDHSLILVENTPAETFIDNIDRMGFDNWAEHEALYPDGKPIEEMPHPRAKGRRQVPMHIRAALDERAKSFDEGALLAVA
jgi:hypothetical protein